jgi:hypothetical protein
MSTTYRPRSEPWVYRVAAEAATTARENHACAQPPRIRAEAMAARKEIHDAADHPPAELIDDLLTMLRSAASRRDYEYIASRALVLHTAARALNPPF